MASVDANRKAIQDNRKKVFLLEHLVASNKASAYLTRSTIMENQNLIKRNYEAIFGGNRQLGNHNTDDIFHNRSVLVRNLGKGGKLNDVQENYRNAMINKVKLEYLDHRSKLNGKVNHISEKLAAINALLIEVNHDIMAANEEVVQFNASVIADNANIIKGGADKALASATPDSNAQIIAANAAKIEEISKRVQENQALNQTNYDKACANRKAIDENTTDVYARRQRMQENRKHVDENAQAIATFISTY